MLKYAKEIIDQDSLSDSDIDALMEWSSSGLESTNKFFDKKEEERNPKSVILQTSNKIFFF